MREPGPRVGCCLLQAIVCVDPAATASAERRDVVDVDRAMSRGDVVDACRLR